MLDSAFWVDFAQITHTYNRSAAQPSMIWRAGLYRRKLVFNDLGHDQMKCKEGRNHITIKGLKRVMDRSQVSGFPPAEIPLIDFAIWRMKLEISTIVTRPGY
jgi:hypothetical protein